MIIMIVINPIQIINLKQDLNQKERNLQIKIVVLLREINHPQKNLLKHLKKRKKKKRFLLYVTVEVLIAEDLFINK